MAQELPPIGAEVPTSAGLPPIGGEVSASETPHFKTSNAFGPDGKPLIDSVKDFATEATAGLNPLTINHAIQSAFWHPIDTARGVVAAQDVPRQKAMEAFKQGDYVAGMRHAVDWLIPLIGPRLDQAGDYMQHGEIAKGLGATTDVGMQMAIPAAVEKVAFNAPRFVTGAKNAVQAAAVKFGEQHGIPLDAGTATGSQFLKNVQKKVGGSWGGANTVETAQATQAAALDRVGNQLATDVNAGAPVQPVQAGEGVRDALTTKIQGHAAEADTAYGTWKQLAGNRSISLTGVKAQLKPLYNELMRRYPVAQQQASAGLKALDNIVNGPNISTLAETDANLSAIKSIARGADMPELRTTSQGTAAAAVSKLDALVRGETARAGPQAVAALDAGRTATTAKYATADVLDLLRQEPRGVFDQLTVRKDGGIDKLRQVAQMAPDQLPDVGRAVVEEMLNRATERGGFEHADALLSQWEKLGPQTRQLLFPNGTADLDNFWRLARKIGENPNPSGTAQTLNATNLISAIPAYGLAKILYTPTGVRLLTKALQVSVNAAPAARAFAVAQVVRAAQTAGVPLPAAADQQPATATR